MSCSQLATLIELSSQFGDTKLHLTNRANIQMRGIETASLPEILKALTAAGLLDEDSELEAIRNIIVQPSIALCRSRQSERMRALAGCVESVLQENQHFRMLPGKFGFALQEGTRIDPALVSDVTLIALRGHFLLALDNALDKGVLLTGEVAVITALENIVKAFLSMREVDRGIRRMRDAVAWIGADALLSSTGMKSFAHRLPISKNLASIGYSKDFRTVGLGFAFGEISDFAMAAVLKFMAEEETEEVALSTSRALVFPVADAKAARKLLALGRQIDAIVDPGDIRLRVHACVGAPACARGTVPARRDAQAVIDALHGCGRAFDAVHISGCEKGCAYSGEADITAMGKLGAYEVRSASDQLIGPDVARPDLPFVISKLAGQTQ